MSETTRRADADEPEQATPARPRRYAKGERQRLLILEKALEVLAEYGYRGATIREIAARCDISHQALRHYFPSKDDLLLEALQLRDERLRQFFSQDSGLPVGELVSFARENLRNPHHVELYNAAAAEATDPRHPGHAYYTAYYDGIIDAATRALERGETRDRLHPGVEPEAVARIVLALQDGLQLQWLYDNSVDTPALMELVLGLLLPGDGRQPARADE